MTLSRTLAKYAITSPRLDNFVMNGAMRVDLTNAGSDYTINSASNITTLNGWYAFGQATDGVFTVASKTSSPSPPAGLSHSLKVTVTTNDTSIGASQKYGIAQDIPGYNAVDLQWGTANAKPITLSFQVQSPTTGTFGGALTNAAANRSYPFTYVINSASTWEPKTVSLAGDTSGTWAIDNTAGLTLIMDLGAGSSARGTAGTWAGSQFVGATGATSLISTNGATWAITGVKIEIGYVATAFKLSSYTQELLEAIGNGQSPLGVSPFNVPQLDANGRLPASTIPWFDPNFI